MLELAAVLDDRSQVGLSTYAYSPHIIKTFKSRWRDPEFKGKTVALDATLLTTRFFYTQMDDETLESKKIVIGWHRSVHNVSHEAKTRQVV
jgi:hypothetical protein